MWARGFQHVLVRLSLCPSQLGVAPPLDDDAGHLRLADSPALREFLQALKEFDRAVLDEAASERLQVDRILADESTGSPSYVLLHLA